MSLQEKIQADIANAMRTKEILKLGVLRMMKTAVKNKEIEKMIKAQPKPPAKKPPTKRRP